MRKGGVKMENKILIELRILKDSGNLKAFADVIFPTPLGDITIRGFRVVQKEKADPWVGFPQTSFQKNGKTQYVHLLDVSRRLRSELQNMILKEYEKNKK